MDFEICSKSSGTVVGSSDLTPSPSDSGISELEAALKDRDSELSYLRQAMEQNTKVRTWPQNLVLIGNPFPCRCPGQGS